MTPELPRTVVLGAGNPFRRDDGAGPAVARRLAGRLPAGVTVAAIPGDAADLLAALEGAARAVIVDATASGAPAGTVRVFDAAAAPLPATFCRSGSSHGLGVAEAVELARVLGRLPPRLTVYGIEGADFTDGEGLSPAVDAAVEAVAGELLVELSRSASFRTPKNIEGLPSEGSAPPVCATTSQKETRR